MNAVRLSAGNVWAGRGGRRELRWRVRVTTFGARREVAGFGIGDEFVEAGGSKEIRMEVTGRYR